MSEKIFDRETLLDLTVNFIPLGIIMFFIGVFAVVSPWGVDPLVSGMQFAIVGIMAVALVVLTYYAGKAVSTAETKMEADQSHGE